MKKISYFLCSLFVFMAYEARINAQNFNWAKKIGGTANEFAKVIETDTFGNLIIAGNFSGVIDLDPSANIFNVTSNGSNDIFICKLDADGNFIWGKSIGGPNIDDVTDLKLDNSGNIYLCGFFRSSADFDPSTASFVLSVASGGITSDGFLLKLDSNGNFVFVKQIGGSSSVDDHIVSVALDTQNNIYLTGYFNSNCDLDPGPSQFLVNSIGGSDIFVVKLDNNGNFIFGKTIGGNIGTFTTYGSRGTNILTSSNFVYITGGFDGTMDFDSGASTFNLTSNGQFDCFLLKLDLNGNFITAKSFGGIGYDCAYGLATDQLNNVFIVGEFTSTVEFDPGTPVNNKTSNGSNDGFLLKLNSVGNYQWCNQIGGTGADYSFKVATDINNNVFVSGNFSNSVDFDNSSSQLLLNSNGLKDIYLAAYSSNGSLIYAQNYGSTSDDEGRGITCSDNNVYITGYFQDTVDFDFGSNTANLTSSGSQDAFLLSLNNSFCTQTIYNTVTVYDTVIVNISVTDTLIINTTVSSVSPPNNINTIKVFPNPASTHINIDYGNFAIMNGYQLRIQNSLGQQVFQTNINQQSDYLDLSTWGGNGMYFVNIIDPQGNIVDIKKIVLQ